MRLCYLLAGSSVALALGVWEVVEGIGGDSPLPAYLLLLSYRDRQQFVREGQINGL